MSCKFGKISTVSDLTFSLRICVSPFNFLYLSMFYNLFIEKRKEARKRKKQREKDAEKGEGGADADEMAADDQLLSQVKNVFL